MEVLREEQGAKSENRMPSIVEAGALAVATTVTPHNPTFDLKSSYNEEYIDEKLIGHKPQIPVEPPIERKMNTSTRFMIVSLLPLLIPIFVCATTVFKMGKSKENVIEEPEQTTTKQPEQPTTKQPEQPTTEQPEQTTTKQPEQPTTEEPEQTTTKQPEQPTTKQPEQPTTEQPMQPTTEEPMQPTTEEPMQPTTEQPTSEQLTLLQEISDLDDKIKSMVRDYVDISKGENGTLLDVYDLLRALFKLEDRTRVLVELCVNDKKRRNAAVKHTFEIFKSMWKVFKGAKIYECNVMLKIRLYLEWASMMGDEEMSSAVEAFEEELLGPRSSITLKQLWIDMKKGKLQLYDF